MVLLEMQSSLNVSVAGSLLPLLTGRGIMSLSFWRILVPQAQPMNVL